MCIHKKDSARQQEAASIQGKEPIQAGNTQPTQHNSVPDKNMVAAAAAAAAAGAPAPAPAAPAAPVDVGKEKPRKQKDKKKRKKDENSDNTLEDVPSLMPEIELELLKDRDQVLSDEQLL